MLAEIHTLRDGQRAKIGVPLPGEAAEIVAFLNMAGGETRFLDFRAGEYIYTVEEQEALIRDCRDHADGYMLNARSDARLVANLYLFPQTPDRRIAEFGLCVAKSHWGLGIGSLMLGRTIGWAERTGLSEIRLSVHRENALALGLYRKYGFCQETPVCEDIVELRLRDFSQRHEMVI